MSTWKKASKVNQKVHRERHQPCNRSHLGFLEKHKDYQERSQNENKKKRILKRLKQKVLTKNPDEYNFHMVNSVMINDIHRDKRKEDKHTPDQIKLMKTRDLKYVNMRRTMEKRKIEKITSQLHLLDKTDNVTNNHIFFVDSLEEAEQFDVVKRLDTHPDLLNRRYNRLRLSDLKQLNIPNVDESIAKRFRNQQHKVYTELEKRIKREKELSVVQRKLEIERLLKTKTESKPKLIKEGTMRSAPIYQWKPRTKK